MSEQFSGIEAALKAEADRAGHRRSNHMVLPLQHQCSMMHSMSENGTATLTVDGQEVDIDHFLTALGESLRAHYSRLYYEEYTRRLVNTAMGLGTPEEKELSITLPPNQ